MGHIFVRGNKGKKIAHTVFVDSLERHERLKEEWRIVFHVKMKKDHHGYAHEHTAETCRGLFKIIGLICRGHELAWFCAL